MPSDPLDAAMDILTMEARCMGRPMATTARGTKEGIAAARAAVRKAAREMGEEYTVEKYLGMAIFNAVRLPNTYAPGDRVRVTRIEEAP